jgi:hypothetical protein
MANVCPNQEFKLIRGYSYEEINQKIQYYCSQMAYNQ